MEEWRKIDPCINTRAWQTQDAMRAYIDDGSGRSVDEQLSDKEKIILKQGLLTSSLDLRQMTIISFGLRPRHWGEPVGEPGENLLMLGCYFHSFPHYLMALSRLVDRLGGSYTILAKEYCCAPSFGSLPLVKLDKAARDKWLPKSSDLMGLNITEARRLGAKRMYYFCPNCAYLAKRFYSDCDVDQRYHLDLVVDVVAKARPQFKLEQKIAYLPGCQARKPVFLGASTWDFNWANYRSLLDSVKGLSVTEMPKYCCVTDLGRIFEAMEKKHLTTLVTPCMECYGVIQLATQMKVTLKSVPEILMEALVS